MHAASSEREFHELLKTHNNSVIKFSYQTQLNNLRVHQDFFHMGHVTWQSDLHLEVIIRVKFQKIGTDGYRLTTK